MSQSMRYQAEFAPPPEPARGRSFAMAAAAHVLLFAALGLVTRWTTQEQVVTAEAELWSAVPQQAAPRLVEPEPAPAPEPEPKPEPPKPTPRPAPAPEPEVQKHDAEIALKKQKEEEKKKALEKEKAEKLRKEKLEKEKAEKEKAEKEKKLKEEKAKEQKAKEDKERERKKVEADKRKAEEAKDKAEAARADALRKENLKRMQGLAGATGGENSTGTALKSSGPSASYAGRLVARIKPNITYPGDVVGNPRAEVEVKVGADGTILSRRIVQSSGNKAWDDAVLRAIDKTEVLPRDTDGRVPPVIVLGFRPLD
ncbi:TonB family protein [Limnohabitans sp.]|uniref:energy transducer TonB n=1 Tax=Limnohabitans sp. TaxID=1907725 RepID=UPI0035AD8563